MALAGKIEATCQAHRGTPLAAMVAALIDTYWRAKTERADLTRALYRSVTDMDNTALIDAFARRADAATAAMLASASDARFADIGTVTLTLVTVLFGSVGNLFERNLTGDAAQALQRELLAMCLAYLNAIRT